MQHCRMGNTAKQDRLKLFQHSDFARDFVDSLPTSDKTLNVLESFPFLSNQLDVLKKNFLFCTVSD